MRALALAGAGLLLAACGHEAPPAPAVAQPSLATVTLTEESIAQEVLLDGTIEAANQSTVAAQVNARVEELPFDVGDFVPKGAVIVRFHGKEQAAQLGSAEAGAREAQAQLTDAQTEQRRISDLFGRGVVSRAALDKADAALKAAQARFDAATASAAATREGASNTIVRAPYAGIVVKRLIQVGEMATVGRPLMTGLSLEHLRVDLEAPQHLVSALHGKSAVRVIMPDGSSVDVTSRRISPQADTASHTFHVQLTLPEGQHGAYPGVLVKVAIATGERAALLLPPAAVVERSEVTGAYVVGADGNVSLRYIRTGTPMGDGRVPVLAGLAAGERVATDPIAAGIELKRRAGA